MINGEIIKKISTILSVIETGKKEPSYGQVTLLRDGPNKMLQITYGKHQTTEFGNLNVLLKRYCLANGKERAAIEPFVNTIGQMPSKATNQVLIEALKRAGDDPVMMAAQDIFFRDFYMDPALNWFKTNGFTLPFSLLIVYDSYIHSGGIPTWLRNRFAERTPAQGGEEKKYITEYVNIRDSWLENHSNRLLQNSDYRTDSFIYNIRQDNWLLNKPFKIGHYSKNDESDTFVTRDIVQ